MKVAIKFSTDPYDVEQGLELVIFRAQMIRDVYFHEHEIRPPLEKFINEPLERGHEEGRFWVYRQGTFIDAYLLQHGELFVGHALTTELNDSPEPTFEGYHHVKTLLLQGGGLLAPVGSEIRYSLRDQKEALKKLWKTALYEDIEGFND